MGKKLNELIGYDFRANTFVIGSHTLAGDEVKDYHKNVMDGSDYSPSDVDSLLAQMAMDGSNLRDSHEMLAQAIVDPISQVAEYVEMYFPTFFMPQNYGPTEDNRIPIEDLPVLAFETSDDGAVWYTRAGFTWTRPTFTRFDTGIEVNWYDLEKAGWNFLARQMKYAAWELSRKRDELAKGLLEAAFQASHIYNITGGLLTKTVVDSVLKDQAELGFPVKRVLINPSRLMDMAGFNWNAPNTFASGFQMTPEMAQQLVRTLYIGDYGGANWFTNVHMPADTIYLGGDPSEIGWHQTRGSVRRASDIDITNKRDIHVIIDPEHAGYIGNVYSLAKIFIGA